MTKKREYSPAGQHKVSKTHVSVTRHRRRNSVETASCSVNDGSSKKLKTKTQHIVTDDPSGSPQKEQGSIGIRSTRGRKPLNKIAISSGVTKKKKLTKDSEELTTTIPLVKVGGYSHANKLHRRKPDSTSLESALNEAKEGLGSKPTKATLRTLSQSHQIRKQSANRKAAHRIVKKKVLGRKELKFIRNLQSYREQPAMVTRLNQVNVPKSKPRKRTLSGEFELLDENLLRKQLKYDESHSTGFPSSRSSSLNSKEPKQKRITDSISKHSKGITKLKNTVITSMNRRPTAVKIDDKPCAVTAGDTQQTKTNNVRKFTSSSSISRDQDPSKHRVPSKIKKFKSTIRTLKSLKVQSNEHMLLKKRKRKNLLRNEEPPVLVAELQSCNEDIQSAHDSNDLAVSIADRHTVASPPPVLEKVIEVTPTYFPAHSLDISAVDVSLPLKKRGRPRLKIQTSVLEIEKTNKPQTGDLDVSNKGSTSEFTSQPVLAKASLTSSDVPIPLKRKRGRPKRKVTTLIEFEKITPLRVMQSDGLVESDGVSINTDVLSLSGRVSEIPRKRGHPKLGTGHLKRSTRFKRRRGTYDFPGKKKQKLPGERKSALFMAVNNVRAGKRKTNAKRTKEVLNFTDGNNSEVLEQITSSKLIEDLIPNENSDECALPLSGDALLKLVVPVHTSVKDSESDSDFDDLPLSSFIKNKSSKLNVEAATSVDLNIISNASTIQKETEPASVKLGDNDVLPKCLDLKAVSSNSETIANVKYLASTSTTKHVTDAIQSVSEVPFKVATDITIKCSENTIALDSEHSESLSLNSQASLSTEIKQSPFDQTDLKHSERKEIQPTHLDDCDPKLPNELQVVELMASSSTDVFDGINKSGDANNNPDTVVQMNSPLEVCDQDGKVDDPKENLPNPCSIDEKLDQHISNHDADKQPIPNQEAIFKPLDESDSTSNTNKIINHKTEDDVCESKVVILRPESQMHSDQDSKTTQDIVEQTACTGSISNFVSGEQSILVSDNVSSEKLSEDVKESDKDEGNINKTPDNMDTSVGMDAEITKQVEKANVSTDVAGLKVKLTRNKGNYKVSGHSQSTGSESDEYVSLLAQKNVKSGLNCSGTDEENDVFKTSPGVNETCGVIEEQNSISDGVSDTDNRRVPPLTIKIKPGVTKPVREFALRPKVTRSPIEIIAMKQRKIEEEYQQHEAYRLARRLEKQMNKQKILLQVKSSSDTKANSQSIVFSANSKLLKQCRPCCVTLVDFVKQLKLGKPVAESASTQNLVSQFVDQRPKGIKLKIKNISKHPKIVGKRGRPPKLKPKHLASTPAIKQLASNVCDQNETQIDALNDGFVGSFVEFLKKSDSKKPSTTKEDASESVPQQPLQSQVCHQLSQDIPQTLSNTNLKEDSLSGLADKKDVRMECKTPDSCSVSSTKYCCKSCNFTTPIKQTMELHVYRHIPGISFKCGYCACDFASMASASAHAKNEHVAQEPNTLKSREVIEADHYFIVENEDDTSQTASGQLVADGASAPVVINVVVKGNVAVSAPGYSVPSKRFMCTHCKYCTNVKGDITQHVHDIHECDRIYICTLCSDNFYSSEDQVIQHCSSTHPSRPCSYRQLPSYYDMEQLRDVQKMKQDDRGNIFERMTHLFQTSAVDENQPDEVIREQHYQRAREFLYIQEGWMSKTSAEADSTTRDSENFIDIAQKDGEDEEQHVSDHDILTVAGQETDCVESLKADDTSKDLVYQEPHDGDDESGISELKIIEVVSLRDKPDIIDHNDLSESQVGITEHTMEIQHTIKVTETITQKQELGKEKLGSNSLAPSRSSNLPEIDVDAIVQRNERLTCTYKCQKCNIHSPYLSAMVEHLKNHHTDIALFTCPYCKGGRGKRPQFSSELNVHEHVKMVHPTNFAKNEVSLSDAAKEFVQVIAIPSGAECSKVGNTFVIEKDIYMCLRCQAHMPSLDYTFSHLEREHTEVFVYVCPHCKIFKDKTDDVVFDHIALVHNQKVADEALPLAIEDNLFLRVPSISRSGSYNERVQGSKYSNQKSSKVKPASFDKESNVKKGDTEEGSTSENKINENRKPLQQEIGMSTSLSHSPVANQSKSDCETHRINPRKQADPTHALMMDCENIDDLAISDDDAEAISNDDVVSSVPCTSVVTSYISNIPSTISSNTNVVKSIQDTKAADVNSLTKMDAMSERPLGTPSPSSTIKNAHIPLNKFLSISHSSPKRKSSIYSIADRLHRLHAQNKTGEKTVSSGDHCSSNSPPPVSRAVLKVPSVPLRNTLVASPQTSMPQSLSNATVGNTKSASSISGMQRNKSLLFSNCPLDLSSLPFTRTTSPTLSKKSPAVTPVAPQHPVCSDEELRPESFQIFNLKPKRNTDSPQVLPPRSISQNALSAQSQVSAATVLSCAQPIPSLQTIHQAFPLTHLTPVPFPQVPIRLGLGIQSFVATGQPTLITLRQPVMGAAVVQDPLNYHRVPVNQQPVQIKQQQQIHRLSNPLSSESFQPSSGQGTSGADVKGNQLNSKSQRSPSLSAAASQLSKYSSTGYAPSPVRQHLLKQAEFYCPYCNEFRPLREYEVLPHIQRSHPRKEVLFLRRDKI